MIAKPGAGASSLALTNQANGTISFRVRGLHAGQIGSYVTSASNVQNILVDRRGKVNITAQVTTAMSNVSFVGGVFKLDLNLKNNSTSTYVPLAELNVVKITSASGTVSVKNADNAGNGKKANSPALFGYSSLLGADQQFAPAEITGNRTLEFNDSAAEMFSFDVSVTAYRQNAGGAGAAGADGPGSADSAAGNESDAGLLSQLETTVMRVTVNPLTGAVSVQLL